MFADKPTHRTPEPGQEDPCSNFGKENLCPTSGKEDICATGFGRLRGFLHSPRPPVRWSLVLIALSVVVVVLAFMPGRTSIPPRVQPDYCYQLIAADRLYEGLGLTSLQASAPNQPWGWQYDYGFLTQWPIGYALLVCSLRFASGLSTVGACQWISVFACAAALAGWFTFIKRSSPPGVTGVLLAAVAAGGAVSTASLIDPSTDALLVALVPFALLFMVQGVEHLVSDRDARSRAVGVAWLALAGFAAGGMFWLRYASLFLPLAMGTYLLIESSGRCTQLLRGQRAPARRDLPFRGLRSLHVAVYALCAAAPIIALLLINNLMSPADSTQQQFNLGHKVGFDFSFSLLTTAWWNLTDLRFYDYHRFSHWLFAVWPAGFVALTLLIPSARRAMRSFISTPAVCLSALVLAALLGMLVGATTLFGDKYTYVDWVRYYAPARPLYFLLFVAPVLLIPRRVIRVLACAALILACSWTLQQEWSRTYKRWIVANREVTAYGQWAVCFGPGAAELYEWLGRQQDDNLIVLSNFREYITLETKIPALPIPDSAATLNEWVANVCASRGITQPRILFVLDPDNHWRSYWLPPLSEIVRAFALTHHSDIPAAVSAQVFEYAGRTQEASPVGGEGM